MNTLLYSFDTLKYIISSLSPQGTVVLNRDHDFLDEIYRILKLG